MAISPLGVDGKVIGIFQLSYLLLWIDSNLNLAKIEINICQNRILLDLLLTYPFGDRFHFNCCKRIKKWHGINTLLLYLVKTFQDCYDRLRVTRLGDHGAN